MANRYFLPQLPPPGPGQLTGELAHHLGRVLHVRVGERLLLGDGIGGSAAAIVTAVTRDRVQLTVDATTRAERPRPRLLLAFALPRHSRAEWLFEHGTEVGVATFQPLWTDRTRPQGERGERWRKIVLAAAGQCDRDWLPEVHAPREFGDWLEHVALPQRRYLAAAGGSAPSSFGPAVDDHVLLVGPEGGFTEAEQQQARDAAFVPLGLGPHILRTETAALVGAALLIAEAARTS